MKKEELKLSEVVKRYRAHNDRIARQQQVHFDSESPEAARLSLHSVIEEMRRWREQSEKKWQK